VKSGADTDGLGIEGSILVDVVLNILELVIDETLVCTTDGTSGVLDASSVLDGFSVEAKPEDPATGAVLDIFSSRVFDGPSVDVGAGGTVIGSLVIKEVERRIWPDISPIGCPFGS